MHAAVFRVARTEQDFARFVLTHPACRTRWDGTWE